MTALNPFFSIGQHLDAVLNAHFGAPAAERQRQAARALERVELKQSMAGRYPHQLSGGQLQRVMLALAVACQPQVLIADEPTTALDVTLQAKLMDLLHSLTLEGMGLLLISHDLALVAQCADRVAVMYAGEAVERGSAAQVLSRAAHPYTQALLNSQPRLGVGRMQLATLPGQVARAEDGDAACAFALRCGRAQVLCFSAAPAFIRCAPEHSARCHFAGPLPQEGPAK
jgi:oligopeptide/dipeptide ABC transporter ATP-binding protein